MILMKRGLSSLQRGAALLTSLLILLVLSLLAVASMQNVSLQERMVSAVRDGQIALEAAEFAAREAELVLDNNTVTLGNFGVQTGLYEKATAPNIYADATWAPGSGSASIAATGFPTSELAVAPRYLIEHVGQVTNEEQINDMAVGNYGGAGAAGPPEGFRIVAWSSGRTGQTRRIIEVYYGKGS
ncbi:MAG: PilX N-terminal domain-containing pilus assembly protein [Marinobacter sp.]|uniref:PilX N-terminal domain-containing pilus assembly protein n=1 Tax=Marinobacter sp. TaxID=50741 RepID=UPI00299D642E|nr:PilX N-terminal domain-containing pilus assembly protein [Marinobacter sp.]MDX1634637.1 PilX N-terminal domain-containing pilus assembly protein [Marinobacter sp.]